jgi:hypothetical protein
MNSPFVQQQARALVRQPDIASAQQPEERIQRLYRRIYGRAPDREEVALGLRFVRDAETETAPGAGPTLTPWEQYAQVLLLGNEFAFVD